MEHEVRDKETQHRITTIYHIPNMDFSFSIYCRYEERMNKPEPPMR
jgi:hypothetical protein